MRQNSLRSLDDSEEIGLKLSQVAVVTGTAELVLGLHHV